jgi:hypothetical protein
VAEVTSLSREESIRAWAGSRQDLLRLGEVMDKQFVDARREALLERHPARGRIFRFLLKLMRRTADEDKRNQRHEEDTGVKLEVVDEDNKLHKDQYKALLDRIELRDITKLTLSCAVDGNNCTVRLSKVGNPGSALQVEGEPAWAREAFASVSAALKDGRPSWHLLRHPAVTIVGLLILFLAGLTLFWTSDWIDNVHWGWSIAGFAATYALPLFIFVLGQQLFPPFELSEPGRTNRRQKLVRTGASLAGAVVTIATVVSAVIGIVGK